MLNFSINKEALKILHRISNVIYWLGFLGALVILCVGFIEGAIVSIPVALFAYVSCWTIRYILSGEKQSVLAHFLRYLFRKFKEWRGK